MVILSFSLDDQKDAIRQQFTVQSFVIWSARTAKALQYFKHYQTVAGSSFGSYCQQLLLLPSSR